LFLMSRLCANDECDVSSRPRAPAASCNPHRFRGVAMRDGRAQQFVVRRRGLLLARTEIGQSIPPLPHGIRGDRHLRLEERIRRFGGHVDAGAVLVELPTVIDAAQPALFVAAEKHRRAAVRAERIDQTHVTVAIAKCDEVFAEQTHAHRSASFSGSSLVSSAGCQYRRSNVPIGVPAPTRVIRSLSCGVSMTKLH